ERLRASLQLAGGARQIESVTETRRHQHADDAVANRVLVAEFLGAQGAIEREQALRLGWRERSARGAPGEIEQGLELQRLRGSARSNQTNSRSWRSGTCAMKSSSHHSVSSSRRCASSSTRS